MTALFEQFSAYISQHRLFDPKNRLFVAVSGGLDSVVLLRLLHNLGYAFTVVHCHFGLRGAESDRDALFVQQLSEAYNAPFLLKHFDTTAFAGAHKLSIQEAARKLRYDWFANIVAEADRQQPNTQKAYLLTAHHTDDNIETVVMNFFKGTGISGIRGMQPQKGYIVRPLLFARRARLEQYATAQNLHWVEDSSNSEVKYTRNFFRHEVLPLIAQKYPQALENVAANIPRFSEVEILYQQAIDAHRKNLVEQRGAELFIPVLKLERSKPLSTIAYALLKPYGFTAAQTGAVLQLLQSESGRFVLSATHRVVRHRQWLVVAPLQTPHASLLVIEGEGEIFFEGNRTLHLEKKATPKSLITESNTALLDAKALQFPLLLRRWKKGDYFYPLGMRKKKKIARFLIDQKLSLSQKEKIWVLESGKKIAWVVGLRIDDRFKVTPATAAVYQLTSSPALPDSPARHG